MCSSLYINYTSVKNILSAPKQNGTKSYIERNAFRQNLSMAMYFMHLAQCLT